MSWGAHRILLIEKSQETREALEQLLQRDGYLVDSVSSDAEAAERARWKRPDLILISQGGVSDQVVSVARSLRTNGALTDQVPVVIFSVTTIPDGSEQEVDGNIHLILPDNFNQLRALLTRLLSGSSCM